MDEQYEYHEKPSQQGRLYEPTDKDRLKVSKLIVAGVSQDDICMFLDIDPKTLRKHYRRELDTAYAEAVAEVGYSLFQMAVGDPGGPGRLPVPPNPQAATAYLKLRGQRYGWSEKVVVEDSSSDFDPSKLTDEEIRERMARLQRSGAALRVTKTED